MHEHQWRETSKWGVHIDFPTKTQGRREVMAIYVGCPCGQIGFRRPGSKVVYTWSKEDA